MHFLLAERKIKSLNLPKVTEHTNTHMEIMRCRDGSILCLGPSENICQSGGLSAFTFLIHGDLERVKPRKI